MTYYNIDINSLPTMLSHTDLGKSKPFCSYCSSPAMYTQDVLYEHYNISTFKGYTSRVLICMLWSIHHLKISLRCALTAPCLVPHAPPPWSLRVWDSSSLEDARGHMQGAIEESRLEVMIQLALSPRLYESLLQYLFDIQGKLPVFTGSSPTIHCPISQGLVATEQFTQPRFPLLRRCKGP